MPRQRAHRDGANGRVPVRLAASRGAAPHGAGRVGRDLTIHVGAAALACVVFLTLGLARASGGAAADPAPRTGLVVWRLEHGEVRVPRQAPTGALPVGSLQKPFVVRAWAEAHVGATPPRWRCDGGASCWLRSGHGTSDLVRALSLSCNAYFAQLARDTPPATLERVLRAEGFEVRATPSAEAAIGLPDGHDLVIAPAVLLRAYARLVTRPWPAGDGVRRFVLQGLRESARHGTAQGLGRRGLWAKTGTVPALDGTPLTTSGWVLALDDGGSGLLALLPHGTGREAARLAGQAWATPAGVGDGRDTTRGGAVRVRLLDLLQPQRLSLRNLSPSPVKLARPGDARAWLGPEATLALVPGTRVGPGLLELRAPEFGFVRRLNGALTVERGRKRALRVVADVPLDEYVAGVLAAEAPHAEAPLREALAATLLRFLAGGPRHAPEADVCDGTHCAVFGGRGPRLIWSDPRHARVDPTAPPFLPLAPSAWQRAREAAQQPGPRFFTGHCGGAPLAERYVWGAGDARATACPRHASGPLASWRRTWSREALQRVFGAAPRALRVDDGGGVWHLAVEAATGSERLTFDEAHRRLAAVLGWDALPSPAARVHPIAGGFEAEGVGAGHRVGLCLAP